MGLLVQRMFRLLGLILGCDLGQDLAEYCLITALIALLGLGILVRMSGGLQSLWVSAGNTIGAASVTANPGSSVQNSGPKQP
jgi:Flp pilus assembly pilin Flp